MRAHRDRVEPIRVSNRVRFSTFGRLAAIVAGCAFAVASASAEPAPRGDQPIDAPPDRACVEQYDPHRDYFPHKARVRYARGFRIGYHGHYKIVEVLLDGRPVRRYLLVRCGAPVPEGLGETARFRIPIRTAVALSTTHLPHFPLLKSLDALRAAGDLNRVTTPSIRARIDTGKIAEVANGALTNLEAILDLSPDLVTASAGQAAPYDVADRLRRAGLPVAVNADYLEPTLLGRAEWIKFTAAFLDRDGLAERRFAAIADRFRNLAERGARVPDARRPSAFAATPFSATWYVAAGGSFPSRLIAAAGGRPRWADNPSRGSLPLGFEAVLDRAAEADYWFVSRDDWPDRAALRRADPRLGALAAVRNGRVYANDARTGPGGGNAYWEMGVMEPDVLLADLLAILHPELIPDHVPVYYRRLP